MFLIYFLNDIFYRFGYHCFLLFELGVDIKVAVEEVHFDDLLEYTVVLSVNCVLLYSSNKPPSSISTIVTRVVTKVKEIGNESMPQVLCKDQDVLFAYLGVQEQEFD